MFKRGKGSTINKFWKEARPRKKDGSEGQMQTSTYIVVGPGRTQFSVKEIREMAESGRGKQKLHFDGNTYWPNRIDAEVKIGTDDWSWTKEELAEIADLMEETDMQKLAAERRRMQQSIYDEAFEAELRERIEAEVRAELVAKAKADAAKVMKENPDDREIVIGDGPADAGESSGEDRPARKVGRPRGSGKTE